MVRQDSKQFKKATCLNTFYMRFFSGDWNTSTKGHKKKKTKAVTELQEERDAIFRHGRERLSLALGQTRLMDLELRVKQHLEQKSYRVN